MMLQHLLHLQKSNLSQLRDLVKVHLDLPKAQLITYGTTIAKQLAGQMVSLYHPQLPKQHLKERQLLLQGAAFNLLNRSINGHPLGFNLKRINTNETFQGAYTTVLAQGGRVQWHSPLDNCALCKARNNQYYQAEQLPAHLPHIGCRCFITKE